MLNVEIKNHDYELSSELREKTVEKFGELDTYMQGLSSVLVSFSWSKDKEKEGYTSVKAEVRVNGKTIDGSTEEQDAETALDETQRKLKKQIEKEKGKELDKRDQRGQWDPARNK